ncbi:MAG: TonB family protein [Pseudomonadota bacterium]
MGIVAALHVGVLFIIARSMGIGTKLAEPPPFVGTVIDAPVQIDDPPPTPQPNLDAPQDSRYVDTRDFPELQFEQDVITGPPQEIIEQRPTGETFQGPVMVGVRPDSRYPLTKPPYPPQLIREGKTGSADVEVYVLPTGRVGDARIVRSSGFESLDQSTLAEAKRKWRLLPATRDGVPIAQWHRLRVVFKLNEQ